MKIQIIGMGKVGSSIAFAIRLIYPEADIYCIDVNHNRLKGEELDFYRMEKLLEGSGKMHFGFTILPEMDYHIITAGYRYDAPDYEDKNAVMLYIIRKKIKSGRVLVVTNPKSVAEKHGEYVGDVCDNILDGKEIVKCKGYTNWGIATEVLGRLS
jgi:malate/lactate dehydrogenase